MSTVQDRQRADTVSSSSTNTLPYNELGYSPQPKDVPESRRSTAVSGYPHIPSSPPSYSESTKSSPGTELARPSSRPSRSSRSSSSGKSIRWGENDSNEKGRISPGHYSADSPKCPFKPILKNHEAQAADLPSLFTGNPPFRVASLTMDDIRKLLVSYLKNFQWPSELDFSLDGGSHMMLPDVEKSKSFIELHCKLQKLAYKLSKVPSHGDVRLMNKGEALGMSIGRALCGMEELKFYEKFIDSAYDNLVIDIHVCLESFVYPCELDFPENSEGGLILCITEKNKSFIDQLRTLDLFRVQLGNIPEYDNEQLKGKREAISEIIQQNLDRMRAHQLNLYYRWPTKVHQPRQT
ncbi:unnamed protein product [Rhizoctonia solani]|uniref:Uncharacterized protein n=1 Tax=Rhizoctonia solani TaxID=456999 RepID=A0A8H3B0E0_9AGAM|nr:unnamed protein product [Rhizoctonia solani]